MAGMLAMEAKSQSLGQGLGHCCRAKSGWQRAIGASYWDEGRRVREALRYPSGHARRVRPASDDGETTIAPRSWPTGLALGPHGESCMRLILGIIIGCALTLGVAYVVDSST